MEIEQEEEEEEKGLSGGKSLPPLDTLFTPKSSLLLSRICMWSMASIYHPYLFTVNLAKFQAQRTSGNALSD